MAHAKEDFKDHVFLKATIDGRIVGSIRGFEKDGTCYVSKLMVHPDFQNQGIGTQLMKEIEDTFAACIRFELYTGHKSKKNIHLYEKLGYKTFKSEKATDNLSLIFYEKIK